MDLQFFFPTCQGLVPYYCCVCIGTCIQVGLLLPNKNELRSQLNHLEGVLIYNKYTHIIGWNKKAGALNIFLVHLNIYIYGDCSCSKPWSDWNMMFELGLKQVLMKCGFFLIATWWWVLQGMRQPKLSSLPVSFDHLHTGLVPYDPVLYSNGFNSFTSLCNVLGRNVQANQEF